MYECTLIGVPCPICRDMKHDSSVYRCALEPVRHAVNSCAMQWHETEHVVLSAINAGTLRCRRAQVWVIHHTPRFAHAVRRSAKTHAVWRAHEHALKARQILLYAYRICVYLFKYVCVFVHRSKARTMLLCILHVHTTCASAQSCKGLLHACESVCVHTYIHMQICMNMSIYILHAKVYHTYS